MSAETRVCRTCLSVINDSNCISVSAPANLTNFSCVEQVLKDFISELDLNLVTEPIICLSCWSILESAYGLKAMCLKNESRLLKYFHEHYVIIGTQELLTISEEISKAPTKDDVIKKDFVDNIVGFEIEKSDPEADLECLKDDDSSETDRVKKSKLKSPDNTQNKTTDVPSKEQADGRLTCEICGRSYGHRGHLHAHLRTHKESHPYLCEICGKRYTSTQQLRVHLLTHGDKKLRTCDICNKSFSHTTDMNKHRQIHQTEKKYRCETCGKGFSQASYLNTHLRIHRIDKQPFKCDFCPKSYLHRSTLTLHLRTHTGLLPYECKICYKSFGYECMLKRHMLGHSTERPHRCNVCGKGFNRSGYLKSHMRIHAGEKAFVCEFCGRKFSQNSCRRRHLRKTACGKLEKDENGDEEQQEKNK